MKNKLLLIATSFFVTVSSFSQEFKKDLAVKDSVCTVSYQKTNGVNRICVYNRKDTLCFFRNNLDNAIFLNTVKLLLDSMNLIDSMKVIEHDYAISNMYEHFIKKEAEINFWDDHREFIGLKESEVIELKKYLILIQEYNRKYRIFKTTKSKNVQHNAKTNEFLEANESTLQGVIPDTLKELLIKREILKRDIKAHFSKRKYSISLIGNANVVSSFKTVDKTQLNAGFGVMASRKGSNGFGPFASEFLGIITVAQSNDTIKSSVTNDFGQAVLVPGVRRFSLLTSFRQTSIFPLHSSSFLRKVGFAFNINVTPYQWIIPSKLNENQDSLTAKVLPASMDVMFPFTWMYHADKDNEIYIATDIGFTFRYLGGNMSNQGRSSFLGNQKQFYSGVIGGLTFRYNGLKAQFHVPILLGKQVEGLTNGQAYASIGLITDIISDVKSILKPKKEESTSVN